MTEAGAALDETAVTTTAAQIDSAKGNRSAGHELDALNHLLDLVEKHRRLAQRVFKGDPLIDRVLNQTRQQAKALTRVVFRENPVPAQANSHLSSSVEGPCEGANGPAPAFTSFCRMTAFNAHLAMPLIQTPKVNFDVVITDNGCDQVTYSKVLLSGWHIDIDKETFERLAFDPDFRNGYSSKDSENLHFLAISGSNLLASDSTAPQIAERHRCGDCQVVPLSLVYACAEIERTSRQEAKNARHAETVDRAKLFSGLGSEYKETVIERMVEDVSKGIDLPELHVWFVSEGEKMPKGFLQVRLGEQNVEVALQVDSDLESTISILWRLVRKMCAKNVKLLKAKYVNNVRRACFQEKFEYWNALRTTEGTTQKLLLRVFDACLNGAEDIMFESAAELAERYKREYKTRNPEYIVQRLIQWQASGSLSTGFVSGLGGFVTMAVSVPAALMAVWVSSARLAFAIASIYGYDIWSPAVCAAVLHALVGSSSAKPLSDSGAKPSDADASVNDRDAASQQPKAEADAAVAAEQTLRTRLCQSLSALAGPHAKENLDSSLCAAPTVEATQAQNLRNSLLAEDNYKGPRERLEINFTSLYELFDVDQFASQATIRSAFRKKALRCHPDKVRGTPEEIARATVDFQILVAAFEVLGDPASRQAYDRELTQGSWRWSKLNWDGLGRARQVFARFSNQDLHDPSLYVATRVTAQVTLSVAEEVAAKTAARSLAAVELRSSLAAGKHLAASASARSGPRLIPFIGAIVSATIDCATTASVGRAANRVFKPQAPPS